MNDFDARLQALRLRFHDRLRDQAARLAEIGARLDRHLKLDQATQEMLSDEAHKLAGIGASLGYPEISQFAKKLEVSLSDQSSAYEVDFHAQKLLSAILSILQNSEK